MRDTNRLKERVELHLDRRQVTSIALMLLLLAGTVFALGVMVGKNLAPQSKPVLPAASLLDRLDARQLDAGGPDGLTFQEELTRRGPPDRPALPVVRAPPPKVEHVPAPAPVINLPSVPEAAPSVAPTALAPAKDGGPIEPETVEVAIEDAHKESPARPPSTPAPKPGAAPPPSASFFTVQVKATQSQSEAEKFAAKLHQKGYHSTVAEADVPGKGRWYRVRVGHFDSRVQAEHYLGDFERETHLTAFVTAGGH